jgi:L-lactate permease
VTILYLLSLTVFTCCDKMSCRHMLYLLGTLLFFIALATMALFFLLTFTSIIFNSGCNYMATSLANPNTFTSNHPSTQPMCRNWGSIRM